MRCKLFTLLYGKFTQDNTHQILSELARFCRRYNKKHFGVFSVHSVFAVTSIGMWGYTPVRITGVLVTFIFVVFQSHFIAEILLLPHLENRRTPYGNSTSDFDFEQILSEFDDH